MPANKPCYVLMAATFILLLLGIVILTSVSAHLSQEKFASSYYFLNHQIIFGIIPGIILLLVCFKLPLGWLKKWAPLLILINIILAAMVFLPGIGVNSGGASRWLWLGKGITFQPSEFLKLTFILYLASLIAAKTEKEAKNEKQTILDFSQTLIAFLIVMGIVSFLLIRQPDVGTWGIIALVGVLVYFLSGTPLWHSLLIALIGAGGLALLIPLASYRMKRWLVFLNPDVEPLGIGYQIKQALIAVGSGGIFGLGLGMSRQKFGLLPQPMSDSIFAIFSEETGFLGAIILISLFLVIIWNGFKMAKTTADKFLKSVALGISSWIGLQSLISIGTMIGILPLTGIPLPFISYGGSHLVVELAAVGILLNISKNA